MCGIAGVARREPRGVDDDLLARMAGALRHRGPDGFGLYTSARIGLANTRLSIVGIVGGAQPLTNEDGRLVITYNGEVYNHVELREQLEAAGHVFRTRTDTEVLVHGYEEWGAEMLHRLNGQFAFAIYDRADDLLFLARDRFGVRPLFYADRAGDLYFASEVKALFASGEVEAAPDVEGLNETFTFWAARAPRTVFRGVRELEPGTFATWRAGRLLTSRYYFLRYPEAEAEPADALRSLDGLMRSSVALRLRADVPVGGYLSGGLDSGIACTLAAAQSPFELRTFSVAFDDPRFDESGFQRVVAESLRSRHAVQRIGPSEIAAVFPEVVRHAETPLLRTAPAPLYLLSRLTREHGIKVVLTGEGADELFLGYDLFKEVQLRLFCARQPASRLRPLLFDRLYPYLSPGGRRAGEFWRRYFLDGADVRDPLFSHQPRWALASRIGGFYSADTRAALDGADPVADLRDSLPADFARWSPLNRAAYLEMTTLLAPYLLSSQGDRMAMAHGVEGRFPFLDHRLFEQAAALPERSKLRGLREKEILRRWAARVVPPEIAARPKQPYRAPDAAAFFGPNAPDYVHELLGATAVRDVGLFDPKIVARLVSRCVSGRATGFAENQALVAVLSTQLWHRAFFGDVAAAPPAKLALADVLMREETAGAR